MFEHIKQRITKDLIGEIYGLTPTELELIGNNVIALIENKKMIHHGLNKNYKPSGYTVDSFSNDSMIIGEYSTDEKYFHATEKKENPTFEKIFNDIAHAVNHNKLKLPNRIYLITSMEEPALFRSTFNLTAPAQEYGDRIVIMGARELARTIYEQAVNSPTAAQYFKQCFKGFSENLDNYEYYGKVPAQCHQHFRDSGILDAISKHHFNDNKICVLYGVSGSGKTQAAIDYIHSKKSDYENLVWISGEDWRSETSLSAVQRSRGGTPINVAGLFNSAKTILIIDSIERNLDESLFAELKPGFDRGGVVLATSQLSANNNDLYLAIPTISENVALQILGEDSILANKTCTDFIQACRFSPLILATTRNILKEQDINKSEFYKEVLNSPDEISGPDGLSIMRKILSRLDNKTLQALENVANSTLSTHDVNFLRSFISINACVNLQRLSILLATSTPGVMKIHDLVLKSAQTSPNSKPLADAIEEYVRHLNGDMTPSALREIHIAQKIIYQEHIRRGERDPDWLTYALLQVDEKTKNEIHEKIHSTALTNELSLVAAKCIIDAKEVHSYTIEDRDERKKYYEECAIEYEKIFEESSHPDLRAELLHHRAKSLRRCGQHDQALDCFTQLLYFKPEWHATHNQIAHLGTQRDVSDHVKQSGEKSMQTLLDRILKDATSVPLRVSLAAFARLRSYKTIIEQISSKPDNVKKLADIISLSALEGLGQFYEAFVSFTSYFGYRHSSCCVTLAESLPEILAMPPELVEKNQWISACEALTNTSVAAARENKEKLSKQLAAASIMFANEISKKNLSAYETRAVAKAYMNSEDYTTALSLIEKVPEKNIDHWLLYRKSEAQSATNLTNEAIITAHSAFKLAIADTKAKSKISIYHDRLSKCHHALGEIEAALTEASLALENCVDDQYRIELANQVKLLSTLSTLPIKLP